MPLDGGFIHCLAAELQTAVDTHIEKVHIPSKNEFLFSLKGRGVHYKLFISVSPERPRVNFTTQVFENPETPPMFCMLLRKYLCGGRITAVKTQGCERLLIFEVQTTSELGDRVTVSVMVELMGHTANLVLVNEQGKIVDCARRSDFEKTGRLLQPGALYSFPEQNSKTDFLNGDIAAVTAKITQDDAPLHQAILKEIAGLSPLLCREVACRCGGIEMPANKVQASLLLKTLTEFQTAVTAGGKPTLLLQQDGTPKDFTFLEIAQYGTLYVHKNVANYSELLDLFYGERDRMRRLERFSADLVKIVRTLLTRCERKLRLRQKEKQATKNKEQLRIYGELLKANLYRVPRGAAQITVENYYDENCAPVTIPLNVALTPAQNAAKFFKDYKKACTAEQTLEHLIADYSAELDYLQSVQFALQNAEELSTLREISVELQQAGYLKTSKKEKSKKQATLKPMVFECEGFKILVGRNNLQNDVLTLKTAQKNDLWFHTKGIHGSHVILCTGGLEAPNTAILKAAQLAAYYSKARLSGSVPVDYTLVKYVKKPTGAKPGMVIYSTNKTLFVTPEKPEDFLNNG